MADVAPINGRLNADGVNRFGASDGGAAAAPLLRRLRRFAELTAAEVDEVGELARRRQRARPGAVLLAEGRATTHFVLSGWACRQRVLRDGRRQIFDLVVPGESFGLGSLDGHIRQTVVALTSVETVEAGLFIEDARTATSGGLWRAIRAAVLEEEGRRLDHMVRLGRLTAYEKAAHFILEMHRRVGPADSRSFPLPLTQEAMADTLGLSVVHLNRVLRQLRAANIVEIRGGVAMVRDPQALAIAAVL